jgi:hypothetical protein
LSPKRLVFIDETWATTAMTRRYGRARRGRRLVAAVPHGHWKTTTFVAALRLRPHAVLPAVDANRRPRSAQHLRAMPARR